MRSFIRARWAILAFVLLLSATAPRAAPLEASSSVPSPEAKARPASILASVGYEGDVLPWLEPDPAQRWRRSGSGSLWSLGIDPDGTTFLRSGPGFGIIYRDETAATSANKVEFEFRARLLPGSAPTSCLAFRHFDENQRMVAWAFTRDAAKILPNPYWRVYTATPVPVGDVFDWHVYRVERDGQNGARFYVDGQLVHVAAYANLPFYRDNGFRRITVGICGGVLLAKVDIDYLRYTISPASPEPDEVFYPADTLPDQDPVAPWASAVRGSPKDWSKPSNVVSVGDGVLRFRDTEETLAIYVRGVSALSVGSSWVLEFLANYQSGSRWGAGVHERGSAARAANICFQNSTVTNCRPPGWLGAVTFPVDPRGWHVWRIEKDGSNEARYYRDGALIGTLPYAQLPLVGGERPGSVHFGDGSTFSATAVLDVDYLTYRIGPVAPRDTTPPVISPQVTGQRSASGWYTSDVSVTWSVSDPESAITSSQGCTPFSLTEDGEVMLTCSATSAGGTASANLPLQRDATPLTITGSRSPEPNASGWNNADVTVSFVCDDALSGLASCSDPTTVSTEGADQSVSGEACDLAGNCAEAVVGGINIDKTAPTITGSRSPDPNASGWNNTDVTASFLCDDTLSGVASCPEPTTVSTEGADQSVSGEACDLAGNCAEAVVSGINIDKTAPTITGALSPDPNASGWNNTDVTVSFACHDALSGLASCPDPTTVSTEGADQSVSGEACDLAGNCAEVVVSGINIDKTPPTITYSGNVGPYEVDQFVDITCTAADIPSGIASDTCEDISGDAYTFWAGWWRASSTSPAWPCRWSPSCVRSRRRVGVARRTGRAPLPR